MADKTWRAPEPASVFLDWGEAQRSILNAQGYTTSPPQLFAAFAQGLLTVQIYVAGANDWADFDWDAFQSMRQNEKAIDPAISDIFRNGEFNAYSGGLTYVDLEQDEDIRNAMMTNRLPALDDETYLQEAKARICLQDIQALWPEVLDGTASRAGPRRALLSVTTSTNSGTSADEATGNGPQGLGPTVQILADAIWHTWRKIPDGFPGRRERFRAIWEAAKDRQPALKDSSKPSDDSFERAETAIRKHIKAG